MEASRKVPRLTYEEKGKEALDAQVWGKLQEYVPLDIIYKKLPQEEFSRLRLVCKEWNNAALQRLLPKPYFVTITSGLGGYHWDDVLTDDDPSYLNGIVSYDVASGQWSFKHQRTRLPNLKSHVPPFEVEGLILCHTLGDMKERGVFNVHTQTWHVIPPGPKSSKIRLACGLMVDTSEKPYTFKLIEGNTGFNTQIYDFKSRSWSSTSSRLIEESSSVLNDEPIVNSFQFEDFDDTSYSCICNKGHVYISIGLEMILTYSMEEDTWSKLDFPEISPYLSCYNGEHNSMGVWEGRIFTTTEHCFERRLTVWELVDAKEHKWVEFARMPDEEYSWLHETDYHARADALVMFNMTEMKWEKVDLPMGTVATYDPNSGDPYYETITDEEEEGESDSGEEIEEEEEEDEGDSAEHI